MHIFSHRGESKNNIENTMPAFYDALLSNSDGIETDIRKTKDNVLVLFHDKTIDRLTKKSGKLSNYTYTELLNISLKGEKIVTLDDFLKYFSNKNIKLFLEIKEENIEKSVIELIDKYNVKNVIIISFKYSILKKINEINKTINLGYLVHKIDDKIIKEIDLLNIKYVLPLSTLLSEDDVIELKNYNIKIIAWGLINQKEIKRMKHLGIYGIMYDSFNEAEKYV